MSTAEKKNQSREIIYIAGNSRSGSTLLGILLGAADGCFYAGELTNIGRSGLRQEYCSCRNEIDQCEIWSKVYALWEQRSPLSAEQYQAAKRRFEGNKQTLSVLKNYWMPSAAFQDYCEATKHFFEAIQEVTKKDIIIDSSKSGQRILVLRSIFKRVVVIHLCRDFSGVLNSGRKHFKKDLKQGIELEIKPRKVSKILFDWIATNLVISILKIGTQNIKVRYNDYVNDAGGIMQRISAKMDIPAIEQIAAQKVFLPVHVLAGNRIRMQPSLEVRPRLAEQFDNLNKGQKRLARMIDTLFFFW